MNKIVVIIGNNNILGQALLTATAGADGTARLTGLATGVYAVRAGGQTLRLVIQ